ncbi:MAG: UbiA prenyltransferase family protein [Myxococcales bacterium]|nr:UbiA prenyltransferase family protein [Myxococcales bacterium]
MDARRQGVIATAVSVGRLHIVAIAALGCFTFGWLLTGHHPWAVTVVCAVDWFLVNLLNRVVDLQEDRANAITGTDFVARHRRAILYFGFFVLGLSLILFVPFAPYVVPFRLGFHLLGFAYNWPLFGARRVKQLYFWKNCASATGFLLTVFAYPLAWTRGQLGFGISWSTVAATAVFFFLFELSYEVIYDLRDAPGDARAEVRTYPVVHGEAGAARIIDALCLSALGILVAAWLVHVVPWRICILGVGPLAQLYLYKRILKRGITSADCINLTWLGVALLVAYHGWVLAGLPGVV